MKKCSKCLKEKDYSQFYKRSDLKHLYKSHCKSCVSLKGKKKYETTKEEIKNKSKERYHAKKGQEWFTKSRKRSAAKYYDNNKEKIKVGRKKYNLENKEKISSKNKRLYRKNKEKKLLQNKRWKAKNKYLLSFYAAKRRHAISLATPKWANMDLIKSIYIKCSEVCKDTGVPHHVDHIVPINGDSVCGLHVENNLQIITATENMSKGKKYAC